VTESKEIRLNETAVAMGAPINLDARKRFLDQSLDFGRRCSTYPSRMASGPHTRAQFRIALIGATIPIM
jgi:hypothetical protein